jgi:integrase/recombinase XerD
LKDWSTYIKGFRTHLKLERSLAGNSVDAYIRDVQKLTQFLDASQMDLIPEKVELKHLQDFLRWITGLGMTARTQARVISGLKGFYKYLLLENLIVKDPTEMLESPRIGRKLPSVMSVKEIDQLLDAIDLSKPGGERNRAMLETLYGCGLRVSELVNLKISCIFFNEGFLKVIGKGNKERLIPLGSQAHRSLRNYLKLIRPHGPLIRGNEDIVFLNRRGNKLTRVMVFTIIKDLVKKTGMKKKVSPHTFRHSFATHLVEGGADLRAVQEMLGHESITTTEIYTHLDREYLRSTILQYHPRG